MVSSSLLKMCVASQTMTQQQKTTCSETHTRDQGHPPTSHVAFTFDNIALRKKTDFQNISWYTLYSRSFKVLFQLIDYSHIITTHFTKCMFSDSKVLGQTFKFLSQIISENMKKVDCLSSKLPPFATIWDSFETSRLPFCSKEICPFETNQTLKYKRFISPY